MIRDDNYYVVKGWMTTKLGLKGTQLALYAILHGFTQDGQNEFTGSIKYLAEFAGVSQNSCRDNLQELERRGLIRIKRGAQGEVNSYAVVFEATENPAPKPQAKSWSAEVRQIVAELNRVTGKNYKPEANDTKRPIEARLNEGYKLADFQKVIRVKTAEWKGNEKMEPYLRPSTLFGSKFQAYLNQKETAAEPERSYNLDAVKQKDIGGFVYQRKK